MPLIEKVKSVPGWPGYRISNLGKLESCRTNAGKMGQVWKERKPRPDKDGYLKVILHNRRVCRYVGIHNLVLLAFKGAPLPNQIGLHNDGDLTNNRIDNLRWGTHKENHADREKHGRTARGERNGRAKIRNNEIPVILGLRQSGWNFCRIARRFNVHARQITRICQGHQRKES